MLKHVLLWMIVAGCSSSSQDKPPPPSPKAEPAKPCPPLAMPPHTQLVDPDLMRALCLAPQLMRFLKCDNVTVATAVLHASANDARYPWVAIECRATKDAASLFRDYVSKSQIDRAWNAEAPTTLCQRVSESLYTVSITNGKSSVVIAGSKRGVVEVKRAHDDRRPSADFMAGVAALEQQLGSPLALVTLHTSKTAGTQGIDEGFWDLEHGKLYSDL